MCRKVQLNRWPTDFVFSAAPELSNISNELHKSMYPQINYPGMNNPVAAPFSQTYRVTPMLAMKPELEDGGKSKYIRKSFFKSAINSKNKNFLTRI
jgi:hypothetical protein